MHLTDQIGKSRGYSLLHKVQQDIKTRKAEKLPEKSASSDVAENQAAAPGETLAAESKYKPGDLVTTSSKKKKASYDKQEAEVISCSKNHVKVTLLSGGAKYETKKFAFDCVTLKKRAREECVSSPAKRAKSAAAETASNLFGADDLDELK